MCDSTKLSYSTLALLTWQDLHQVCVERIIEKGIVWLPALMCNNSRTTYSEPWRGCFTSVLQHVVMGFDIDNTLLLMKCSKEDMLEGMLLLLVGVSLLLKKYRKEDVLESMV